MNDIQGTIDEIKININILEMQRDSADVEMQIESEKIKLAALEKQQEIKRYLRYLDEFDKYDNFMVYQIYSRIEDFIVEVENETNN